MTPKLARLRILAKRFPDAEVTGITLSPEQVRTMSTAQCAHERMQIHAGSTRRAFGRGSWLEKREVPGDGRSQHGAGN